MVGYGGCVGSSGGVVVVIALVLMGVVALVGVNLVMVDVRGSWL